jgi:MYXO-CTERM domain-containing protein
MVQANTPGERDGRIAIWLDGALVGDFHNLRFRDIDSLKIDRFGLAFHIGSNPNGVTRKWYDNLVVAESYIGPLYSGGAGDGDGDGDPGDGDGDPGDGDGDRGDGDGESDDGTGSTGDPGAGEGGGCSCHTGPAGSIASLLPMLALLGLRRRSSIRR